MCGIVAYFGKKDAQQLNLISLMVKQLFMDVNIIPIDTMREKDGLAMSSRNAYLCKEQRIEALKISTSLQEMVDTGVNDLICFTPCNLFPKRILSTL